MTGNLPLNGTWEFHGQNVLNGRGGSLEFMSQARIKVAENSVLYMTDISLRNIGAGMEGMDEDCVSANVPFDIDQTSTIYMTNVDVSLVSHIKTYTGTIYIDGPATFILVNHNWTFSHQANLRVDSVSLWLDTIGAHMWAEEAGMSPGQLKVPMPTYAGHIWQWENHEINNGPHGNLDLLNTATIREVTDRSQVPISSVIDRLFDETGLTEDLYLDQSVHVPESQTIWIRDNLTLFGQGSTVIFSHPTSHPQFKIDAGKTVTLDHIELSRINNYTFQLGRDAKIRIADGVRWELSEDVTFGAGAPFTNNGRIEVLSPDSSGGSSSSSSSSGDSECWDYNDDGEGSPSETVTISTSNSPRVFYVRGLAGIRRLTFTRGEYRTGPTTFEDLYALVGEPTELEAKLNENRVLLGVNTMALKDIELIGVDSIYAETQDLGGGTTLIGSVGLCGNAASIIKTSLQDKYFNNIGYIIEGVSNEIRVANHDVTFYGALTFGDFEDNVVTMKMVVSSYYEWPTVNFEDSFLNIESDSGRAAFIFGSEYVNVVNNGSNSFKIGNHSFFGGRYVKVGTFPIKQTYQDTILSSDLKINSDLDNAIVTMQTFPRLFEDEEEQGRSITALHLQRARELQHIFRETGDVGYRSVAEMMIYPRGNLTVDEMIRFFEQSYYFTKMTKN